MQSIWWVGVCCFGVFFLRNRAVFLVTAFEALFSAVHLAAPAFFAMVNNLVITSLQMG